jgi:hypothetical protein
MFNAVPIAPVWRITMKKFSPRVAAVMSALSALLLSGMATKQIW